MKALTNMERLRRAARAASRAADLAHTAAWRASRAARDLRVAVADLAQTGIAQPIGTFLTVEAERQYEAAYACETACYRHAREATDMAELLGAKP